MHVPPPSLAAPHASACNVYSFSLSLFPCCDREVRLPCVLVRSLLLCHQSRTRKIMPALIVTRPSLPSSLEGIVSSIRMSLPHSLARRLLVKGRASRARKREKEMRKRFPEKKGQGVKLRRQSRRRRQACTTASARDDTRTHARMHARERERQVTELLSPVSMRVRGERTRWSS